jgi:hypothetical protein
VIEAMVAVACGFVANSIALIGFGHWNGKSR